MMNKQMNMPALQKIMREFERQNERMEMTSDMMGDSIDDAFAVISITVSAALCNLLIIAILETHLRLLLLLLIETWLYLCCPTNLRFSGPFAKECTSLDVISGCHDGSDGLAACVRKVT